MIPSGELEARLESNIRAGLYELLRAPQGATVVERNVAGEASVAFTLPEGCLCIKWSLPPETFGVLRDKANADGAFILRRADGSFEAHVVECKRTINRTKWAEVRKQMRWTLSRLRALAGILGVELRHGVLYTAFRADDLSPESAPNPIAQRRPIDAGSGEDETSRGALRALQDPARRAGRGERPLHLTVPAARPTSSRVASSPGRSPAPARRCTARTSPAHAPARARRPRCP